jgi:hypothetical protein
MADASEQKFARYLFEGLGTILMIVGGEPGLTAFAKAQFDTAFVVYIVTFAIGLAFFVFGFGWSQIQPRPWPNFSIVWLYKKYGKPRPVPSLVIVSLLGAATGAFFFGGSWWLLSILEARTPSAENNTKPVTNSTVTTEGAASPIDQLSELGWTVDRSTNEIRFEITSKPLPNMEQSASYLRQLPYRFSVQLQSVPNIDGLHYLAGIAHCTKLTIGAGAFTDISELRTITQLQELAITQTPLTGPGIVDVGPLAPLTQLNKLVLGSTRVTHIGPLGVTLPIKSSISY